MVKPANGAIHCRPGRGRGAGDDEDAALRRAVRAGPPRSRASPSTISGRSRHRRRSMSLDLLIDDAVDGERGLADRPVADDQFALAAAEREHRIDDEHAGLHRLVDEIALDDCRRRPLDRLIRFGVDRRAAVERAAEGIDDAPEQAAARPARARPRLCRARRRRPRCPRARRAARSRRGRGRGSARSRPGRRSKRSSSSSRTSARPETSAMPSATLSTRPTCSAAGASVHVRTARRGVRRSQRSSYPAACRVTVQLLRDAVEIGAPAVADDGVAAAQLDAGDQRRIARETSMLRSARRRTVAQSGSAALRLSSRRSAARPQRRRSGASTGGRKAARVSPATSVRSSSHRPSRNASRTRRAGSRSSRRRAMSSGKLAGMRVDDRLLGALRSRAIAASRFAAALGDVAARCRRAASAFSACAPAAPPPASGRRSAAMSARACRPRPSRRPPARGRRRRRQAASRRRPGVWRR